MRARKDAKAELIAKLPLFAGCSKKELGEIATVADELDLPAGRTLIRQGDHGREFFVIADGEASVTRNGRGVPAAIVPLLRSAGGQVDVLQRSPVRAQRVAHRAERRREIVDAHAGLIPTAGFEIVQA